MSLNIFPKTGNASNIDVHLPLHHLQMQRAR